MAEFFTTLMMKHDAEDQEAAIEARFLALRWLEENGFDVVGANTDDEPRGLAMRLVMGDPEA